VTTIHIGVHVCEDADGLRATLDALAAHTAPPAALILLPDGPEPPLEPALAELRHLPQLATREPRGAAACFNRLVRAGEADLYVLLESGCIVGPGWLEHLLAALAASPSHGLAGPSTNRSWNEQGVFSGARGGAAAVQATAQEALRRFGPAWRTLEPLYSLADFCYAVTHAAVQAIGAADEGYGLGPCWEMDFNIRAARAGFQGVWAGAAYVWRPPFGPRRRLEEQRRFAASRQRYQDKFCALRLRGERPGYEPHCRGDACQHFAPPGLIELHLPLDATTGAPSPVTAGRAQPEPPAQPARPAQPPDPPDPPRRAGHASPPVRRAALPPPTAAPLVSCLMPTRGRGDYVVQAIGYLQRQDYPHWELIILDDGDDGLAGRLPADARIRYQATARGLSIGAKRNQGCTLARGEIIAQWDDDDWYGPNRLRAQVEPLLAGAADITGLQETLFFELERWQFWRCTPALHQRLFVGDVHGGTLVFRKRLWELAGGYPNRSLAEDAALLRLMQRRGGRLLKLPNRDLFIYLRHAANAWSFTCGQYLDPAGWLAVAEPPLPAGDRAFYRQRREQATTLAARPPALDPGPARRPLPADAAQVRPAAGPRPLVSCIMPTAGRRAFVGQAIACFLRQDYSPVELVVVDDGADAVADLMPDDGRVRYLRLPDRRSVGAKRNLACQAAAGEIIVHWDDDDWSAPRRLHTQVEELLRQGADICGLSAVNYYDPWQRLAWQYVYPAHAPAWAAGNTLCYRKDFWRANPFADIDVGEDTRFVQARLAQRLAILPDASFFVALIHAHNVSPKQPRGARWHPLAVAEIERLLGEDLAFYAGLRGP